MIVFPFSKGFGSPGLPGLPDQPEQTARLQVDTTAATLATISDQLFTLFCRELIQPAYKFDFSWGVDTMCYFIIQLFMV